MLEFSVLPNLMHQDLLDKFSILSINHDPLDHFLSMHHGVLNEFLMADVIDASTKHHPTAFITTCILCGTKIRPSHLRIAEYTVLLLVLGEVAG